MLSSLYYQTTNRLARLVAILIVLCFASYKSVAQCPGGLALNPSSANIAGGGAAGSFTVTGSTCPVWTANSDSSWLTVTSFTGNGTGVVNYLVSANPDLASRSGKISVVPNSGPISQELIFQSTSPGDFTISSLPTSQTVPRGSSTTFTISVNRTGGFTGAVALSVPAPPSGITPSFSGNILTLKTDPNMATGSVVVTIQGGNGNVTHTTAVTLIVNPQCSVACVSMQTDGNLVLYNAIGQALWSSATAGSGAAIVRVQDDGNLVLYALTKVVGGVFAAPSIGPFPPQTCKIGTLLHAQQFMWPGQCITSPKGQYFLYMSPVDGNLFIYDIAQGHGTWNAAGTPGNPGDFLNFQTDGNLVVYNSAGNTVLWQTTTSNSGATLLNMEDDGRIILWRPVWNTGTSHGWGDTNQYTHPACDLGSGTGQTGAMAAGQCFVSPNGRFELLLNSSNNLMLLDNSVNPPLVMWQRP
jgi:hypothetical protein